MLKDASRPLSDRSGGFEPLPKASIYQVERIEVCRRGIPARDLHEVLLHLEVVLVLGKQGRLAFDQRSASGDHAPPVFHGRGEPFDRLFIRETHVASALSRPKYTLVKLHQNKRQRLPKKRPWLARRT
jgi:hypothetical protein